MDAPQVVYQTDFNGTVAWEKTEPAELSPHGRSGHALKLSTYVPNGEKGRWLSPAIAAAPGHYTVSGWFAQNLAFVQDPGYGGAYVAICYDNDGKEIHREPIIVIARGGLRDAYDYFAIPSAGGLDWNYCQASFVAPARTASMKLLFAWSDAVTDWRLISLNTVKGEVYLDDVMVTAGTAPAFGGPMGPTQAPYPYKLRLNTPVEINAFLTREPLEFTVRLDGPQGPPAVKPKMTLNYRVEDYQGLLVASGSVPLAQPYYYWKGDATDAPTSLVKTFYLGDDVRGQVGRWLAIVVTLQEGSTTLARGETAFIVVNPRMLTLEEKLRSHYSGATYPRMSIPAAPTDPWGLYPNLNDRERRGSQGISAPGDWDVQWARRQPTRDSPISFAKDWPGKDYPIREASQQTFVWEERNPLRVHYLLYTQCMGAVPKWAIVPGKPGPDGKPKRDVFDAAAFGAYTKEYVKHTNAMTYVITSPEGGNLDEFPEIIQAGYEAVKSVDPRLQVGAQAISENGEAYAKQLVDSGILKYVDFLVVDWYATKIGPATKAFLEYLDAHGQHRPLWLPEYGYNGSLDQEEISRRAADFIVSALANDVDKITWYTNTFEIPTIRSPLPPGVTYALLAQVEGQGEKLSPGLPTIPTVYTKTIGMVQGNLAPLLQLGMFYNLTQATALERCRGSLAWGDKVEGALFDGEGYSTAVVWRPATTPSQLMMVDCGDTTVQVTDMYGRQQTLTPVGGKVLLTIGEDPLVLKFASKVGKLTAQPGAVAVTCSPDRLSAAADNTIQVTVTNDFGVPLQGTVTAGVDASWKCAPAEQKLNLAPGAQATLAFTLTAPAELDARRLPVFVTLSQQGRPFGWVEQQTRVSPAVGVDLSAIPFTTAAPAQVVARVRNAGAQPLTGKLLVQGDFGPGMRPPVLEKEITVPAGEALSVAFPLTGWTPSMARDYPATARFTYGGFQTEQTVALPFRGVTRVTQPIKVDGDPSDWPLDKLVPLPMFRLHALGGTWMTPASFDFSKLEWTGPQDNSGKFYVQWDQDNLYFLFLITDDEYRPQGQGMEVWPHDVLHLAFYPRGLQPGEPPQGIPYKAHIGMQGDGTALYDQFQDPSGDYTPQRHRTPPGVQVAVKRLADGTIAHEFAVPFAQIAPLAGAAGSQFAMAVAYWDDDGNSPKNGDGVGFYYGTTNVDTNPAHFGVFTLVK